MAHVYWRLQINEADSGIGASSGALAEWVSYDSSGALISTSGATASGSALFSGSWANIIDGNTATGVTINGYSFPQYAQIQFASAVAIDHFDITSFSSTGGSGVGPSSFDLQYSDNGSAWTTAFSYRSAMFNWSAQETLRFYTTGIAYRLKVTACGTGTFGAECALGELAFYDAGGSAISTATGTVLARHEDSGSGTGSAAAAFDSTCSTWWISAGEDGTPSSGNPVWVGFHFPTVVAVASIRLTSPGDGGMYPESPTAFTLQKSLDGAAWTDVQSYTATWASACQTQTFTISSLPSITISPSNGYQGHTYSITVTGSNTDFISGVTTVTFGGSGGTTSSVSVASATSLTFSLTLSGSAATGAQTITVTTGSEALTATFVVFSTTAVAKRDDLGWSQIRLGTDGCYGSGAFGQSTDGSGISGHVPVWGGPDGQTLVDGGSAPAGGSVTSVAVTVPSDKTVSGSPITGAGIIAISDNTQSANTVKAGPASGGAATPGYRALVAADLPIATTSALGAVKPDGTTITISGGVISAAGGGGGGGTNHYIQNLNVGVPSLASLTQVNVSGTGSVAENAGIALTIIDTSPPADSGLYLRGLAQAVPGTAPYRVAFFVLGDFLAINYPGLGVGWRDSGTGKLDMVMFDNGASIEHQTYSSATSRASVTALTGSLRSYGAGYWLGLRDDNAGNAIWEVSQTGAYWTPVLTVVKSSGYLATYSSQVVFALFCDDNTFTPKRPIAASVLCWDVTAISGRVVGYQG